MYFIHELPLILIIINIIAIFLWFFYRLKQISPVFTFLSIMFLINIGPILNYSNTDISQFIIMNCVLGPLFFIISFAFPNKKDKTKENEEKPSFSESFFEKIIKPILLSIPLFPFLFIAIKIIFLFLEKNILFAYFGPLPYYFTNGMSRLTVTLSIYLSLLIFGRETGKAKTTEEQDYSKDESSKKADSAKKKEKEEEYGNNYDDEEEEEYGNNYDDEEETGNIESNDDKNIYNEESGNSEPASDSAVFSKSEHKDEIKYDKESDLKRTNRIEYNKINSPKE